ncbi:MAG: glycosyltransferase 87 family protein [Myxococcota bacterium]|jgi:hypothetical protein|nr:glycosyltransferase 87 family protein [Myxococcota bacterium]
MALGPAGLESEIRSLGGVLRALRSPGAWFYCTLALGAALRLFLAYATPGTVDVEIWQAHAHTVDERGLIEYYRGGRFIFNHPPTLGIAASGLSALADATGLSFAFLFRLPFALLDALTALLLFSALGQARNENLHRARYALTGLYWICPLSVIFSSYHGNTDSALAFFLLASSLCLGRGKSAWAGALLGLSLWVKIPGLLALPVLLLAAPSWRERFRFGAAFGGVALLGYLPWLLQDPESVIRAVFLYQGLVIQTTSGMPIWGLQIFYPDPADLSPTLLDWFRRFRAGYYEWNTLVALGPIAVYALLRAPRKDLESILAGIAGSYFILYGLTNFWAFQYLAWALPLWPFLGFRLATLAQITASLYIYGLYAWLSGSPILVGEWDFIGQAIWPSSLVGLRDACFLFFFGSAFYLLARASREAWRKPKKLGGETGGFRAVREGDVEG